MGQDKSEKLGLLKNLVKMSIKYVAYINCDRIAEMKSLFFDFNIERLIRSFSAITNETIVP